MCDAADTERRTPVFPTHRLYLGGPIRWFIWGGLQQYPPPAANQLPCLSHTSVTLEQYLATFREHTYWPMCKFTLFLKQCVTFCKDNIRQTRSSVRGDCSTKFKKTVFGQSAFLLVRAAERWNLIPVYIRECTTLSIFKTTLKVWLKENQICDHWFDFFLLNGVWYDIVCVVCIELFLI